MPRKITAWNRYFAKGRKAGLTPKQIGAAWRKGKNTPTTPRKASRGKSMAKSNKKSNGGGSKMFRTLGTMGAVEDFAWGFGGLVLMGANNPVALPAIRLVQGIQGHVFGRSGKGRLVYSLIDLADLIIAGQANITSVFDSLKQLTKITQVVG